ncbi:MAG: polysulfide reductase NrfD [Acidobacteria bacterium]|nr:polysulfide reductase NrfD [Acidobacteriota bacterium]
MSTVADVVSESFPVNDEALFRPIETTTARFHITVVVLLTFTCFMLGAYARQLWLGLGVTGLNTPVYWGIYITNFVFFIGISHAGTLISAILRICHAEWRRSITRAAEVITVMVLFFGAGSVVVDLGHPERALNILFHPNFRSPLLWDVCSVTMYLTASVLYLYLPLIPDLALLRDRGRKRTWLYGVLALGWTGTPRQKHLLERAIAVMAIVVIPIAVTVHTVVSWVFAMTVQPMWHSTIFGPYFVVGAIFSGIAALLIALAIIRHVYHLEEYLKQIHFRHLGQLLLVMALLWFYFTFAEHLTVFYGAEPEEMHILFSKLTGPFAFGFWAMVACCFLIPVPILAVPRWRTVKGTVWASAFIVVGMWLERYNIVVPSLSQPRVLPSRMVYFPSLTELLITLGFFSTFILFYVLFTKFFPIVSVWEVQEGREKSLEEVCERVSGYIPLPMTEADNYRNLRRPQSIR